MTHIKETSKHVKRKDNMTNNQMSNQMLELSLQDLDIAVRGNVFKK